MSAPADRAALDTADRDRACLALLAKAHDDATTIVHCIGLCEHLPAWPLDPPTDPTAAAVAYADQTAALLGALRDTRCFCLHGMPEQIVAHALRTWLRVFRAVRVHVRDGAPLKNAERHADSLARARAYRDEGEPRPSPDRPATGAP